MCTVTIVPHAWGVRVVCNRDEKRTRAQALMVGEQRVGGQHAWFPIDPDSGGTWIGVNDGGLVAVLLNRTTFTDAHPPRSPAAMLTSRGLIVPHVLGATSIRDGLFIVRGLRSGDYAPFTVVLLKGDTVATMVGGGNAPARVSLERLRSPLMFTSSSLGDALVQRPRRELLLELLESDPGDPLTAQERFHDHVWPRQPEISVRMSRPDARTVSRTRIDLNLAGERVAVAYEPIPSDVDWAEAC